jgi:hypothetical protein
MKVKMVWGLRCWVRGSEEVWSGRNIHVHMFIHTSFLVSGNLLVIHLEAEYPSK